MVAPSLPSVVFSALCLLAGPSPTARCQPAPASRFHLPPLVEGTLDNGLRVIVCPRPSGGLVDLRAAVRVGTWLEGEYEGSGISHYFEHLVAGGATKNRTRAECERLVRSLGGVARATTDADRTWFHLTTTTAGVPRAIELMADWIRNCALDPKDVEREKSVILEEFDQYEDFDPRRAWELLHATAFSRHPARLPLQGFRERFERITRDDLVKFHKRTYVPGNVVISVVGDVEPGRAFNRVREAFGDWPAGRVPAPVLAAEPPQTARRFARIEGRSSWASVALGYRSVALKHSDMPALDVLRYLVGAGKSATLQKRIVDEQGLASGLRVFSRTPALGGGLFVVTLQVRPEDVARAEQLVQGEFDRIAREGVRPADFERALRLIRAETVFGLEQVEDLAQTLTRDELQTGDCRYTETYLDLLSQVTDQDLQRVAGKYLIADRLSVAVVGPGETGDRSDSCGPPGPEAAGPDGPHESDPLGNGVRVRTWLQSGSGLVALHVSLGGGSLAETRESNGAASLLSELLLRGGGRELSKELEQIEARGGSVTASAGRWTVDLSIQVLREDLALALRFLVSALSPGVFEPQAFERARARALARIESRGARFVSDAEDRLYAEVYPEHPLGLRPGGTEESLPELTAELLGKFSERLLVGSNLVVGVVGDFDPSQVVAGLALLERLPRGQPVPLRAPAPELPVAGGQPVFRQTGRSQVTLVLAYKGAGVDAADDRVALDLFDAYASGRRIPSGPLFEALRGENDLVYHVSASHRPHPGSGLFFILAQCSPENYSDVLAELEGAVTRLASEDMQEQDLDMARNILLASRQTTHQTAAVRARLLATAGIYDLPIDSERAYRERVVTTGLDRVHQAVRKMLRGDRLQLVIWPEGIEIP